MYSSHIKDQNIRQRVFFLTYVTKAEQRTHSPQSMAKKATPKPKKVDVKKPDPKKSHHTKQPDPQGSELFFRGGASVLKPNHITRYIYPSLCGYPKACLRLQPPANSKKRSRPQGANSWGEDGHTFLTISKALKPAPTNAQFTQWSTTEVDKDLKSKNPLGRAMARVTKYAGNTVLESGKFALKKGAPLVYVIKRTTMIPLGGSDVSKFGREEEEYRIECDKWRSMQSPTMKGHEHDSWWTRLHVSNYLYRGRQAHSGLMYGFLEPVSS